MRTYFITVDNIEIKSNLSKSNAIKKAKEYYDNGNTDVGIGVLRYKSGKLVYSLLPLFFYV